LRLRDHSTTTASSPDCAPGTPRERGVATWQKDQVVKISARQAERPSILDAEHLARRHVDLAFAATRGSAHEEDDDFIWSLGRP